MEKRKDIQIYEHVFGHHDYGQDNNSLYTPVNVGHLVYDNKDIEIKDSDGDNIAEYNYFFAEETGTYWIWKNAPKTKYIGQCQYRRRLVFDENTDFDKIFETNDIILPNPLYFKYTTTENFYKESHIANDFDVVETIIKTKYPQYSYAFDKVLKNGHFLFYSAGYVMKWNDFDEWCNFYFGVIDEYSKIVDYKDYAVFENYVKSHIQDESKYKYQEHIGGFLQERLFTMWVISHFDTKRIFIKNYTFMENALQMMQHYGL